MTETHGALLPALFDAQATQGWRRGMVAVTCALLNEVRSPVVELGCGQGDLLSVLASQNGSKPMLGIDLHPAAFATGDDRSLLRIRADGQKTPCRKNTVALLLALDLLDQRTVDSTALLQECHRILQPGGRLVLRVSAHPGLFGPHDIAFNTARRYRRQELAQQLQMSGFTMIRCTYADSLLAGPMAAIRILQRWGLIPFRAGLYRARWSNWLISRALTWEARWLARRDLPMGLSLLAVARRP